VNRRRIVTAVVLAGAVGAGLWAFQTIRSQLTPIYRGKPLNEWVRQAVGDEDPAKRRDAVEVMTGILLAGDEEVRVRVVTDTVAPDGGAIETSLPDEVLPFLLAALGVDDRAVNNHAALSLTYQKSPRAQALLIEALEHDRNPKVRSWVAQIIGRRKPATAAGIGALRRALEDDDDEVRSEAAAALEKLNSSTQKER
jgi:HEAT repeat protein